MPRKVLRSGRGFTLVELIVVIVILAILAAIAIPALTGYIAKAEDERYTTEARNATVAVRTVLNEAYSKGDFDNLSSQEHYTNGLSSSSARKIFQITDLANAVISSGVSLPDKFDYYRQAAGLIGASYPSAPFDPTTDTNAQYWAAHTFAASGSDANAVSAEGFYWMFFPEGAGSGKPVTAVTYRMDRISLSANTWAAMITAYNAAPFSPSADYEVYHLTQ
jgi:prepilin-type N-terminal cleavage/methylation domain-containing protein